MKLPDLPAAMKSLPFCDDTEKSVLSCFLHSPTELLVDARASLPVEAFYHVGNRLLYEVLLEHHAAQRPVEYIALSQRLQDQGLIDKVGGQGTLAELLDFAPTPTHYRYYKGILLEKLLLRQIIAACTEGSEAAHAYQEDVPGLLGRITERFIELSKQQEDPRQRSFRQIMDQYVDTLEQRMKGVHEACILTRWPSFNQAFGGLTPRYWLIAGFPSDGKSALAQNLAEDVLKAGKHVLWFSYEMDEIETTDRLVSAQSGVESQKLLFPKGNTNREELRRITRAVGEMQPWGLHLRCAGNWTAEQVVAECRAMAQRQPLGLVIVDYLQLVPTARDFSNREQQVSYISRLLKNTCQALRLPFVILSQLNEDGKTRESRSPLQDASNVLCIEIETQERHSTRQGPPITHPAGLRVEKNRQGQRGQLLPIKLHGPTFTFREEGRS